MKHAKKKNLYDPDAAIATFEEAARLNLEDHYRDGCILRLPAYGQAVMTGDLHGHRKNFEKLQKYAMLDRIRARHVVLHEIIHAEPESLGEPDLSHEVLLAAAKYKCDFPEQVHFMQSNHELSQLTGYLIAKNGRGVIQAFDDAVAYAYGEPQAGEVLAAINAFIASFPVAIRTENRIWLSHSLPNVHNMDEFDFDVFGRSLTREELAANRTVFHLVWGRRHTQAHIDALADILDVDVFITGHQPQDDGFKLVFNRLIILASDHSHGTFLPFDLAKQRSAVEMLDAVRKFVAVA